MDLRQSMLVAGPRYTLTPAGRWTPYLHFLVGISQLKASRGDESDRASSFVYGPGVGVDCSLNRHWALRVQEGFEFTRYAGEVQANSRFLLGVVFRK